jgi:hypothetical protein
MDPLTLALAIIAALSEILPLLGATRANGILHAMKSLFLHIHAESDCHVDVAIDTIAQTSTTSGAAEGPATIAAVAVTPP